MQTYSIEWDHDGHAKVESDTSAVTPGTALSHRQRFSWVLVATVSFKAAAIMPLVAALS